MITFAYFLIFTLLTALIGTIDIFFMHKTFREVFQQVISLQFGTRKWWVFSGLLIGIFYCLIADYKQYLAKKGTSEGT